MHATISEQPLLSISRIADETLPCNTNLCEYCVLAKPKSNTLKYGFEFEFEFEFVYSYTLAGVKKSKATNDTVTAFRGS